MLSPDYVSAWADVAQTIIAIVAALVVWYEYIEHKKARRADLAATLIARLDADELIAFAVTSLDWGGGLVVVPPAWRDLLENRKPLYEAAIVEDALSPNLNISTAMDPLRMLYRHAFVRLFNHLQVVAVHVKRDPALISGLEPMADLAHRLSRPLYIPSRELYRNAIAAWYPANVWALIERLDKWFPEPSEESRTR
jgi:hypothetical protein